MSAQICAVIVAYRPDVDALAALCARLSLEATVLVVDNTEGAGVARELLPGATDVLALGTNLGIARAQNVGIARALERGSDVVVLFDQDSQIADGFVGVLTRALDPAVPRSLRRVTSIWQRVTSCPRRVSGCLGGRTA